MNNISYLWISYRLWKELLPFFKCFLFLGAFLCGFFHTSFLFVSPFLVLLLRYITIVAFKKNGTCLFRCWKEQLIQQKTLLHGLYSYTFIIFISADLFYLLGDFITQDIFPLHFFQQETLSPLGIVMTSLYFWCITIYTIPIFIRQLHTSTTIFKPKEVALLLMMLVFGILVLYANMFFSSTLLAYSTLFILIVFLISSIRFSQTHTVWEVPS